MIMLLSKVVIIRRKYFRAPLDDAENGKKLYLKVPPVGPHVISPLWWLKKLFLLSSGVDFTSEQFVLVKHLYGNWLHKTKAR